jgi:RHS repeat-associated protein
LTNLPGGTAYTYDVANRIVSDGASLSASYNPSNQRVWDGTFLYYYGVGGELLGRYRPTFGATSTWARDGGATIWFGRKLIRQAGKWVMADRLGSVRANEAGERFNYYPFGGEITSTPDGRPKFGTYFRDNAGQDYAVNRYYGPGLGRFMSPDAGVNGAMSAYPTSWNRYAYVSGDPVNRRDRRGLNADDLDASQEDYWGDPYSGGGGGGDTGGGGGAYDSGAYASGFDTSADSGIESSADSSADAAFSTPAVQASIYYATGDQDIGTLMASGSADDGSTSGMSFSLDSISYNGDASSIGYIGADVASANSGTPALLPAAAKPNASPGWGTCSSYRDGTGAGDILYQICMNTPNNPWSNCVRGTLVDQYVPHGNPLQLAVYLFIDHPKDFVNCAIR